MYVEYVDSVAEYSTMTFFATYLQQMLYYSYVTSTMAINHRRLGDDILETRLSFSVDADHRYNHRPCDHLYFF